MCAHMVWFAIFNAYYSFHVHRKPMFDQGDLIRDFSIPVRRMHIYGCFECARMYAFMKSDLHVGWVTSRRLQIPDPWA